jgi:hypothetical protein
MCGNPSSYFLSLLSQQLTTILRVLFQEVKLVGQVYIEAMILSFIGKQKTTTSPSSVPPSNQLASALGCLQPQCADSLVLNPDPTPSGNQEVARHCIP